MPDAACDPSGSLVEVLCGQPEQKYGVRFAPGTFSRTGGFSVLRWAGVLFLFYLAWEAWTDASENSPGNTQESFAAPFWRGFLANVLNPKAAIFYISLLPGFISPAHGSFRAQAFTLGTLHILVSVVIHSAIVISAAKVGALVADGGRSNILRKSMAVLIGISAVWLAWETRR